MGRAASMLCSIWQGPETGSSVGAPTRETQEWPGSPMSSPCILYRDSWPFSVYSAPRSAPKQLHKQNEPHTSSSTCVLRPHTGIQPTPKALFSSPLKLYFPLACAHLDIFASALGLPVPLSSPSFHTMQAALPHQSEPPANPIGL